MARYRAIYQKIWKDPDFQSYSPECKLLFIYLCTNESTTESGIYPITPTTISNETGIPLETVTKHLNNGLRNVAYDIENNCVMVRNFRKYNAGGKPDLIQKSIKSDFFVTPRTHLWAEFIKNYPEYSEILQTVLQPLVNGCGKIRSSTSTSTIGITITNPNANTSGSKNSSTTDDEELIFKIYQDNFGLITSPMIADELKDISLTYPKGWFEKAVKEAFLSAKGKPNLKYVISILERWTTEGTEKPYAKNKRNTTRLKSGDELQRELEDELNK